MSKINDKTFGIIILILVLIPLLLGLFLISIDADRITGKATNLIAGKASEVCIDNIDDYITMPPSNCKTGETRTTIKKDGCITAIACIKAPICDNNG